MVLMVDPAPAGSFVTWNTLIEPIRLKLSLLFESTVAGMELITVLATFDKLTLAVPFRVPNRLSILTLANALRFQKRVVKLLSLLMVTLAILIR